MAGGDLFRASAKAVAGTIEKVVDVAPKEASVGNLFTAGARKVADLVPSEVTARALTRAAKGVAVTDPFDSLKRDFSLERVTLELSPSERRAGLNAEMLVTRAAGSKPELFYGPFMQLGTFLELGPKWLELIVDVVADPLTWIPLSTGGALAAKGIGLTAAGTRALLIKALSQEATEATGKQVVRQLVKTLAAAGRLAGPRKLELIDAARQGSRQFGRIAKDILKTGDLAPEYAKTLEALTKNRKALAGLIDEAKLLKNKGALEGADILGATLREKKALGQVPPFLRIAKPSPNPLNFAKQVLGFGYKDEKFWVPFAKRDLGVKAASASGVAGVHATSESTLLTRNSRVPEFDPSPGAITPDDLNYNLQFNEVVYAVPQDSAAILHQGQALADPETVNRIFKRVPRKNRTPELRAEIAEKLKERGILAMQSFDKQITAEQSRVLDELIAGGVEQPFGPPVLSEELRASQLRRYAAALDMNGLKVSMEASGPALAIAGRVSASDLITNRFTSGARELLQGVYRNSKTEGEVGTVIRFLRESPELWRTDAATGRTFLKELPEDTSLFANRLRDSAKAGGNLEFLLTKQGLPESVTRMSSDIGRYYDNVGKARQMDMFGFQTWLTNYWSRNVKEITKAGRAHFKTGRTSQMNLFVEDLLQGNAAATIEAVDKSLSVMLKDFVKQVKQGKIGFQETRVLSDKMAARMEELGLIKYEKDSIASFANWQAGVARADASNIIVRDFGEVAGNVNWSQLDKKLQKLVTPDDAKSLKNFYTRGEAPPTHLQGTLFKEMDLVGTSDIMAIKSVPELFERVALAEIDRLGAAAARSTKLSQKSIREVREGLGVELHGKKSLRTRFFGQPKDLVPVAGLKELPQSTSVAGASRLTSNSTGNPIAATEKDVKRLWRWLGESPVVDSKGRPLVVYHATNKPFDKFSASKGDFGIHFGTTGQARLIAKKRGVKRSPSARTIPAYLKMKKMVRVKDRGHFEPTLIFQDAVESGTISATQAEVVRINRAGNAAALKALKEHGVDGFVYLNRREGVQLRKAGLSDQTVREHLEFSSDAVIRKLGLATDDSYAVFSASQIKSAISPFGGKPFKAAVDVPFKPKPFHEFKFIVDGEAVAFDKLWMTEAGPELPRGLLDKVAIERELRRLIRAGVASVQSETRALLKTERGKTLSVKAAFRLEATKATERAAKKGPNETIWVRADFESRLSEVLKAWKRGQGGDFEDFLRKYDDLNYKLKAVKLGMDIFHYNVLAMAQFVGVGPTNFLRLLVDPTGKLLPETLEGAFGSLASQRAVASPAFQAARRGVGLKAAGGAVGGAAIGVSTSDDPAAIATWSAVGALYGTMIGAAKLNAVWANKMMMNPQNTDSLLWMAKGLWTGRPDDRAIGGAERMLENLSAGIRSRGLPGESATSAVARGLTAYSKELWETLHNGSKHFYFTTRWADLATELRGSAKFKAANEVAQTGMLEGLARELMQSANNAFGGQNWATLLAHPRMQFMARRVMLAPDWTASRLQIVGNMFLNMGTPERVVVGAAMGQAMEAVEYGFDVEEMPFRGAIFGGLGAAVLGKWSQRAAGRLGVGGEVLRKEATKQVMSALIGGYAFANALNYSFTGHFMWDNEEGKHLQIQMTGETTSGAKRYIGLGKAYTEAFEWAGISEKRNFAVPVLGRLRSKASVPVGFAMTVVDNKGFFGEVFGVDDTPLDFGTRAASLALDTLTPIFLTSPVRTAVAAFGDRGINAGDIGQAAIRAIGVQGTRGRAGIPPANFGQLAPQQNIPQQLIRQGLLEGQL